jgi:hypothetical protein
VAETKEYREVPDHIGRWMSADGFRRRSGRDVVIVREHVAEAGLCRMEVGYLGDGKYDVDVTTPKGHGQAEVSEDDLMSLVALMLKT